ncbi:hypothetical protein QJQ45_008441 [Haematococcus lacustris]|nr:hypothetical protein QJQ45_008441 [Haematococcus lacustris]
MQVKKQAQKRWPDRILALAYGAASFSGSGSIGCRGVPVSQMRKEAVKQFGAGRVVLVDEFRTSRVSSAYSHPSEALPGQPPESFRWLRPVYSKAKRSQVRALMCSTSNNIRFYDRDVSAALNIRRCAVGPGPRPTELCYWDGRHRVGDWWQVEQRLVRPAWSQQRDQPVRGMMWCPVVAPRKPPQAPRSSQAATPAAASEPGPSTPPPAKRSKRTEAEQAAEPSQPTKGTGKGKGKAAKAKPAPQPGRWLDRDCNAALNMQRRWRRLELCYWKDQGALPAKGKEYPGLGYKRVRDKPPKAQEHQQQPAVAQ